MKKEREDIDRVKNWKQFLTEDVSISFTENQKRLRKYIKILKDNYELGKEDFGDYNKFDIIMRYFIVIHNFLYLENKYFDKVKITGKELNKYLDLPNLESLGDIINKFNELYDTNSKVRFSVETLDSIEEIRLILPKLKDFSSRIYRSFNVGE